MLKKIVLSLVSCTAFSVSCALPSLDTKLGERAAAGAPGVAGSLGVAGQTGIGQPGGGVSGAAAIGAAGVSVAGAPALVGGASNVAGAESTVAGSGSAVAGASSLTAAGSSSISAAAGASGQASLVTNGGTTAGGTGAAGTRGSMAGGSGRGGAPSGGASNGGAAGALGQLAGASGAIAAAGSASTVVTSPPPGCEGDLTSYPDVMAKAIRNAIGIASSVPITWARVKDLKELKIYCSNSQGEKVPTLRGVECLTGLQTLWVENCQLTDISALGKSVHETPRRVMPITDLSVNANPVTDLTPIGALEELVSLDIGEIYQQTWDTVPLDISVVKSLSKLQKLNGYNSRIASIKGLENHPTLAAINLGNNDLTSMAGLGELKQLKKLVLDQNELTSADGLGELPAIEELSIYNQDMGSSLLNINAFANPKVAGSLKILNLSHNSKLGSLAALSTFNALTSLNAASCGLTNTVGLSNAVNLTTLDLSSNNLESITELAGLVNLATVDLSSNSKLTDITPLAKNPGITGSTDKITLTGTALGTTAGCLAATESLKTLVNPPRSVSVTLSPKCI